MRKEITLAASLLSLLLTLTAPATAQTRIEAAPDESFVIFQDEGGPMVCREATEVERARPRGAASTHVIYHGAPLRRVGERLVANAPADYTGVPLQPSAGLTIVLEGTEQLEANPAAKNAFIAAANRWEALISTPITVRVSVDYGPTFFGTPYDDPRILGRTGASVGTSPLSTVRKRLLASSNPTPSEAPLYNALPASSVPAESGGEIVEVSSIRLTTALARAIGYVTGDGYDALIAFNSDFGGGGQFDFDPEDGIATGQFDFDGVATHELGHALGFISASGGSNSSVLAVWDLFRFRPATAGVANFDSAPRVLTKGGVQVMFGNFTGTFAAQELNLSTGGPSPPADDTDDGRQSSHWKDDGLQTGRPYIGNMDPTVPRGRRRPITENDIRTVDLIGYSVVFDPARPDNDNFDSSLLIGGGAGAVTGTSLWATREPGELSTQGGLQAGSLGDKSVWYSWTAPLTGTVTFTTAGSSFDTTLGVYRGDSVSTVTRACPACENDNLADGTNTSQVQFDATAGAVYRIAVDGWNGEYGTVQLNWSLGAAPTPTPTPTPQPGASTENVVWTNVVGATAAGNSLNKSAGAFAWSAGAVSTRGISSGDGYVEFTATETTTDRMVGLSNGDTNQNFADLDFAIYLTNAAAVWVYEGGTPIRSLGSYSPNDRFRVSVQSGAVKYSKNGAVFYSHAAAVNYPLIVDTSLYTPNATITDAVISGSLIDVSQAAQLEDVAWTNAVGVQTSGNSVTKSGAASLWDAGAVSTRGIAPGDGYVEFTATEANTDRMCGLSNADSNQRFGDIDFAIYLTNGATVFIYENGTFKTSAGNYAAGDRFRVSVENGVVKYYKNGGLLYTSQTAPAYPLLVDTSLHTPAATVSGAVISGRLVNVYQPENVSWTNLSGATASGNSLRKSATTNAWDAGAVSTKALAAGNGYVEFTPGTGAASDRMCGLSNGDANQHYGDIDFAFYLTGAGTLWIYEGGTPITAVGRYAATDRLRVSVEDGAVKYYRNGVLLYSRTATPVYPLLVDTSFYTPEAAVNDVVIVGTLTP